MSEKLPYYLENWSLTQPELLATTATSHVYTVRYQDQTAVLKILTPIGIEDEASGIIALEHYDGVGAVRVYESDGEALLMEYGAGNDLLPMVQNGDDEGATRIIARVLNQLHSRVSHSPPEGLWMLERRFRALFQYAERVVTEPIYVRGAAIARELLDDPREERVLHGDMHHLNVRFHEERGWLAIDPKGIYGERTFDACNTLCNPPFMPELVHNEARLLRNARILADEMNLEYERLLRYTLAYDCLSTVWSMGEDQQGTLMPKIALIISIVLQT